MITITIPTNFIQERTYAVKVLFEEFLGISIEVKSDHTIDDYHISFGAREIVIRDAFWNHVDGDYLKEEYIPKKIEWYAHKEEQIPVIYGKPYLQLADLGIDIFASAFFMLTRWEEHVNKKNVQHDRFPAEASLAYKHKFLHLPVVNQYVELLWGLLKDAGYQGVRKERRYQLHVTCDVDIPRMWSSPKKLIGRLKYYLKEGGLVNWLTFDVWDYVATLLRLKKDPFDTFGIIMNKAEALNTKASFFFLDYGNSSYDRRYRITSNRIQRLVDEIRERKHHVGYHPSYNTYKDAKALTEGWQEVANALGDDCQPMGRQHFLRFEVPTTWQLWEDLGLQLDSTMTYAQEPGFRCGVCYSFPVFNILTRAQLRLREQSLVLMDQSLIAYKDSTVEEGLQVMNQLKKEVQKYQGDFVILWHNNVFNAPEVKDYQVIFEQL